MNLAADAFFAHVGNFMEYRETVYEISENTSRSNRVDLDLFQEFVKERALDAITGPAVMDFQFYLKKRRHNCGASINRKLFTLRSYAKYLECQQVAKDLPFRDILKVKQGYRNQPHALTQEQLKTFFESIDRSTLLGIRDYCIFALMYGLGLRVGEVFRLDLSDMDIENKRITVIGKGGRRRSLHLAEKLVQIITEWIAVRKAFLNSDKDTAFFLSKKGHRLSIRTIEDNMANIVEKAELSSWRKTTPHTLRHTFASHLNDKDTDIMVLQSLLGHTSPRSTEIYIHPSMDRLRDALEKLPGVVFVNQLVKTNALNLKFQRRASPKIHDLCLN